MDSIARYYRRITLTHIFDQIPVLLRNYIYSEMEDPKIDGGGYQLWGFVEDS